MLAMLIFSTADERSQNINYSLAIVQAKYCCAGNYREFYKTRDGMMLILDAL